MYPFLYEAPGNLRIPTYGMLVLLAFVMAFLLVNLRARRIGISAERLIPVYLGAAVFGILGARILFSIAVEPAKTLANPLSVFACNSGGLAFYGGLLGGAAGVFTLAHFLKLPGWKLGDILAPALVLGLGIGRFGCFFAGCCHGAEAHLVGSLSPILPEGLLHGQLWWSSHFPFVAAEFDGGMGRLLHVPLYPTQLWSAFAGISISAVLSLLWERRKFDGQILGLMLIIEPIFRILIESYRADERGYVLSWALSSVPSWLPPGLSSAGEVLPDGTHAALIGITTSQFIGLGMVFVGIGILLARWKAGVAEEIPLEEEL